MTRKVISLISSIAFALNALSVTAFSICDEDLPIDAEKQFTRDGTSVISTTPSYDLADSTQVSTNATNAVNNYADLYKEALQEYAADGSLQKRMDFVKSLHDVPERLTELGTYGDSDESIFSDKSSFMYRNCPTVGNVKALVFMVDFDGMRNTNDSLTAGSFENALNGTSSDGYPYEGVSTYYSRSSFNKLNIDYDVYGWYNSSNERSVYANSDGRDLLINEVMSFYNDTIDFSDYDSNGDGYVDLIYFAYAGKDTGFGSQWWSYVSYFTSDDAYDNEQLMKYGWINLRSSVTGFINDDVITFIHETGHLLGLSDYYDTEASSFGGSYGEDGGLGTFDMMHCNCGEQNIFSKLMLGWVEPVFVTSDADYELYAVTDTSAKAIIVAPEGTDSIFSEYFILEYYVNEGNNSTSVTCANGGVKIYHVDAHYSHESGQFVNDNSYSEHKLISLLESTGKYENIRYGYSIPADSYYYSGMTFGTETAPSSEFYSGTYTGINIHINSIDNSSASISVSFDETDTTAPKVTDVVYKTTLGMVDFINEINVYFSSYIYSGNNINSITAVKKGGAVSDSFSVTGEIYNGRKTGNDKEAIDNIIDRYSILILSSDAELEAGQEYIVTIPQGAVIDSSGNPCDEYSFTLKAAIKNSTYTDITYPQLALSPPEMPTDTLLYNSIKGVLRFSDGHTAFLQYICDKDTSDLESQIPTVNPVGFALRIFDENEVMICNCCIKDKEDADTSYCTISGIYELSNNKMLVILNNSYYIIDSTGANISKSKFMNSGSVASLIKRQNSIDVLYSGFGENNAETTLFSFANDGTVTQRAFAPTENCLDLNYYDESCHYIGNRLEILREAIRSNEESWLSSSISKNGCDVTTHEHERVLELLYFHSETLVSTVFCRMSDLSVSLISIDNEMPKNSIKVIEHSPALVGATPTRLDDGGFLVSIPVTKYNDSFTSILDNRFYRFDDNLNLLWVCNVNSKNWSEPISSTALSDNKLIVVCDNRILEFDDSNKTPIISCSDNSSCFSSIYDIDAEAKTLSTSYALTAAQIKQSVQGNFEAVTIYDGNMKLVRDNSKLLCEAIIELTPRGSLIKDYYHFFTEIAAPTNVVAKYACSAWITLEWDECICADDFLIYQWINDVFVQVGKANNANSYTIIPDEGYMPGKKYVFSIRGTTGTRRSPMSEEIEVIIPTGNNPSPDVKATVGDQQITLEWEALSNASSYSIFKIEGENCSKIIDTSETCYTIDGLTNGTEYSYLVIAYYGYDGTWGSYTDNNIVNAVPLAESVKVNAEAGNGEVILTWEEADGAALYKVYQKSGSGWKILKDTTATSYTATGLTNGTAYTFAVRAYVNGAWSTFNASTDSITATPVAPAKPIVTATAGNASVTLNWNTVSGAALYKVYQKSGSGWKILKDTTATTYTVSGLTNGTTYTFAARAYVNGAWSTFNASTDSITATPVAPAKPIVTATAGNASVTLNWNAVSGATLYKVYQKSGSGWKILKDTTATTYTVSGLTNGTAYTFAARAYVNGAWSAFNASTDSVTATPVAPAKPIVTATAGNASVTLNWNTVSGATLYKVYQKSGSGWKILKDTTATIYTVSGLTNGTTYTFAVRAYVNGAWSTFTASTDSVTATPTAPNKPIVTATAGTNSVTLSWNTVNGATLYKVYQKTATGWKMLKDVTANTYTVTGLTNGTAYTFAVRSYSGSWSAFNAAADSVTATPTVITKPVVTATAGNGKVTLSWGKVNNATLYKVYQKTSTGWKILKDVTATAYTVTGLTNGTTYTFAVRSYSGAWSTFNAAADSVSAIPHA